MEILLDIGNGLKIAKANIDELHEQDLNARHMDKKMFERNLLPCLACDLEVRKKGVEEAP